MDGLEYVPMFWGNKSIADFGGVGQLISAGGVDAVLGMNEPTTAGQSELSPAEAAQLWMQYLEPLKQANSSIRLGSPAMANGAAGIPWMQQFLGNCSSCSVDFTVVHYYYINSSDFISYLNGYHDAFQKPIWVTEWACVNYANPSAPCADSYIPQFMNETQSFMDSTDWVERYAWFGAFRTMPGGLSSALQLYDSNGKITALGKQYIGLGSSTSSGGGGGGGVNTGSSLPALSLGSLQTSVLTILSLFATLLAFI
ncbi:hypothetical protein DL93DRAFT_2057831 [Clavulina sp. PMI_390]|nr:hypothetical protein DL93DRAFT_2057831 [Clavulina sp. PMI_390]